MCYCRVEGKKKEEMQTNEYLRRLAMIIMDEQDRKKSEVNKVRGSWDS